MPKNKKTKPDFAVDLAFGKQGEALLELFFPGAIALNGKKADFRLADGTLLELKTERRSLQITPNLFIERWSDVAREAAGGPWKARENGCKWYAHLFIKNNTLYLFETEVLIDLLELNDYDIFEIGNKAWTSAGYIVPRIELECIYKKMSEPIGEHE